MTFGLKPLVAIRRALLMAPKDRASRDTCGCQPLVHRELDPGRDWHGSNVTTLADEVGDYPMLFSLLEVLDGEPGYAHPAKSATEKNRDHSVVAFGTQVLSGERRKEPFALVGGQPIPDAHSMLLYALDATDSGCKVRAQEPAVGSLVREPTNGGETQVDGGGGIMGLFETDPVARHPASPRCVEHKASNAARARFMRTPASLPCIAERYIKYSAGKSLCGRALREKRV